MVQPGVRALVSGSAVETIPAAMDSNRIVAIVIFNFPNLCIFSLSP